MKKVILVLSIVILAVGVVVGILYFNSSRKSKEKPNVQSTTKPEETIETIIAPIERITDEEKEKQNHANDIAVDFVLSKIDTDQYVISGIIPTKGKSNDNEDYTILVMISEKGSSTETYGTYYIDVKNEKIINSRFDIK